MKPGQKRYKRNNICSYNSDSGGYGWNPFDPFSDVLPHLRVKDKKSSNREAVKKHRELKLGTKDKAINL